MSAVLSQGGCVQRDTPRQCSAYGSEGDCATLPCGGQDPGPGVAPPGPRRVVPFPPAGLDSTPFSTAGSGRSCQEKQIRERHEKGPLKGSSAHKRHCRGVCTTAAGLRSAAGLRVCGSLPGPCGCSTVPTCDWTPQLHAVQM